MVNLKNVLRPGASQRHAGPGAPRWHLRPPGPTSRAVVRGVLAAMGAVALTTGTSVALRGSSAIPGGAPGAASNESVLRFYAVWWAAQGPALWKLAVDPALPPRQLERVCALTFLGGLARVAAVRQSGRPHPLFQTLAAFELLMPPILVYLRRGTTWPDPPP